MSLGHAPLYFESNDFEYMARPNQEGMRFGNKYNYNSYSQRSDESDSTRRIILGLGDSVLFGGMIIDQDSIATSLFSKETGKQMLNISIGLWGPDNSAAYLRKYGLFGAKAMFLVVSSHDAYDNMTFEKVVGKSLSYPNKQYWCAWGRVSIDTSFLDCSRKRISPVLTGKFLTAAVSGKTVRFLILYSRPLTVSLKRLAYR